MKAVTVRVRERFVLAKYGKTSRDRFRMSASKELLDTLTTAGDPWVDFKQFLEATQLVCSLFAEGDVTLAREVGRYGAEANMGVWRTIVYRIASPQTILGLAAGVWNHHYDGGRLVAKANGEKGIRLRIEEFPMPHRLHCLSIEGWLQRTIELGRPTRVVVSETLCRTRGHDACEFAVQWD